MLPVCKSWKKSVHVRLTTFPLWIWKGVHPRVVFGVPNVLKVSHYPCAAAVCDACSTVADTSNTFTNTGPVMLCHMSLSKLFSLLLALAPHVCDTAVPQDVDGVKMVPLPFLEEFLPFERQDEVDGDKGLAPETHGVCRAGTGVACRGLRLVHDILKAIRPVQQNLFAQPRRVDLASQVG